MQKRLLHSKWNAKVTSKYPALGTIKPGRVREQQAVLWSLGLSADELKPVDLVGIVTVTLMGVMPLTCVVHTDVEAVLLCD